MKKIILAILVVLLAGSVFALNLWMSWSIFEDITVSQGYTGTYVVYFPNTTITRVPMISWGTRDDVIYNLSVTATGTGGKFFKNYTKQIEVTNGTSYQYDVYLKVPKGAKVGIYPYELCGLICQGMFCLQLCKTGNVNIIPR